MLQESEKIELKDSGRIGDVSVTNKEQVAVFVRVGSIFKGNGTQSRAVNQSMFIEPGETISANVNCIHASHPISPAASFSAEKTQVAPSEVEHALRSKMQHAVWNKVTEYSSARACCAPAEPAANFRQPAAGAPDNMVDSLHSRDAFADMVNRLLKEVPDHEGQVGMAVIDEQGVYGLEMFDSPESWKVLSKGIVTKYSQHLSRQVDEGKGVIDVKVNPDKVHDAIAGFIGILSDSRVITNSIGPGKEVTRAEMSAANNITGEAIFRGTKFVHLTASRGKSTDDSGRF
jgi:hypothetical protein